MRRKTLAVVLAASLALAGCSAGGGPTPTATPDGGSTTPTPTATPTPTPTTSAAVPGVEDGRLTNVSALVAAQRAALNATSVTVRSHSNLTGEVAGTNVTRTTTTTVRATAGFERVNRTTETVITPGDRREFRTVWANDSVAVARSVDASFGEPQTELTHAARPGPGDAGGFESLLLQAGEFAVEESRIVDGERRVTLVATGINESRLEEEGNVTVPALEATMVVDGDGLIRSLSGRMTLVDEDEDSTFRLTAEREVTALGETTVARPAWVDEAVAELPFYDVNVTVTEEGYVRVTNEGPDTIPADHEVALYPAGETSYSLTRVGREVPPGETVYVYLPAGGGLVAVADEKPTESAAPLDEPHRLLFRAGFQAPVEAVTVGDEE